MESLQPDRDGMAFSLLCNRSDLISLLRIYLYILYILLPIFEYFSLRSDFKFRGRNSFKGGRLKQPVPNFYCTKRVFLYFH